MDFESRTPESNAAPPRGPNLEGDCDIEWTRISANMPLNPGRALDFNTRENNLALEATRIPSHRHQSDRCRAALLRAPARPVPAGRFADRAPGEGHVRFGDQLLDGGTRRASGRYAVSESRRMATSRPCSSCAGR
jgi:hypothetical protein